MTERISVNGVSKKFMIGFKKKQSALERVISLFSGKEPKKILQVLNNISFKVSSGEVVGIIGKNGSGKSTLLRAIAGIYSFDGEIKTYGRVISIIDLNIGMQHRLTMKDNIFLCCSLFGLAKQEIKEKWSSIVKFAELQDFVNTKIYQFSEGMKARLAFSIAVHCSPEILLLDEIFEVGDEDFRNKSADKIKELVENGACVILVSHNLSIIEKYCDRVILMERGEIEKQGEVKKVIREYKK